ncbi:MAG: hypothetical protein M3N93_02425 [Acidobacteriota bacterium]|nr:hypothetical protein [Acidobacteriota bacterium]
MAVTGTALYLASFLGIAVAQAQIVLPVSVPTYQYDNTRAGANTQEAVLTPSNVNTTQFGKLFAQQVDGLVYAQPLYLPNVTVPGRGAHNVVYIATEHDSVYAFDADNTAGQNASPLWAVSFLGAGVTTVPYQDTFCNQITPELGITGTPVVDPASGTLYVVATTKETAGGSVSYVHRLHALDVSTGAEKPGSPVAIQATFPGTGEGGSTLVFNPKNYKQRPGLLLLSGVVYAAFSSHCDIGAYHGWLMGYDAATLRQLTIYNSTPNGNEGSLWAGGAAPAADTSGNIYVVSANGDFDYASGGPDLGESYIKLSSAGGLAVRDYFTPFNYSGLDDSDLDTGSAGVALLGDEAGSTAHPHLMAGAGKEGRIYLLDRDNLGKWQSGSDSQIVQSLPGAIGGLFGNPSYFNKTLYFCGAGDHLKAFSVSNAQMSSAPRSTSSEAYGYPGCVPSISAGGTSNGIVWALGPAGVLAAYDASNLGGELYTSNQNSQRDSLGQTVKFSVPVAANGKVYAGTAAALVVYGLLPQGNVALSIANAASGTPNAIAPGAIASLYGAGLATGTATASSFPIPVTLAGASITVNGIAAPIVYASPSQINFQIPFDVAPGAAVVDLSVGGAFAGSATVPVFSGSPGIFIEAQGNAAAVNQDGSVNSVAAPAPAGSVIALYATGLGAASPSLASGAAAPANPLSIVSGVAATLGGIAAPVLFAGPAPGFAGLYQINIQVPQLPSGQYDVKISVQGSGSNAAFVVIR